MTRTIVDQIEQAVQRAIDRSRPGALTPSTGRITSLEGEIIEISGLTEVGYEELIMLPKGSLALATDIDEARVRAVPLHMITDPKIGGTVRGTGQHVDTPVGDALLGRIIDPLGHVRDGLSELPSLPRLPIHREAPRILARSQITRPLQTGILAVDAAIPIGRGQRELILGDRQTGKTSLAVDAIISQPDDVVSVYCAIGQRAAAVSHVIKALSAAGALARTIIVVAGGNDPPGLQYLAPFAATTMAEYFVDKGRDALIVYDDLTRHACAYREMSLLLKRPPGREAFPGDIFYLHARLLERATQYNAAHGGGSLTALPIVETQAGRVASYIPTNLISITDGQILTSSDLFRTGQLPAIDIGLSVSRVGGKAQPPAYRDVAAKLKLHYAQFEELEAFARFGTRLDKDTQNRLRRGRRVRAILKQNERSPLLLHQQYALLLAATEGLFDTTELVQLANTIDGLITALGPETEPWSQLSANAPIDEDMRNKLLSDLKSRIADATGSSVSGASIDG